MMVRIGKLEMKFQSHCEKYNIKHIFKNAFYNLTATLEIHFDFQSLRIKNHGL